MDMASAVADNCALVVILRGEDKAVRTLAGHKAIERGEGHSCSPNGIRRHEGTFPNRSLC